LNKQSRRHPAPINYNVGVGLDGYRCCGQRAIQRERRMNLDCRGDTPHSIGDNSGQYVEGHHIAGTNSATKRDSFRSAVHLDRLGHLGVG
jgi:hypothetical protein